MFGTPIIKTARPPANMDRAAIELRISSCPRLPSLGSINIALRELLSAENRYTGQIADVIRRDPSLTARLLRLVNSVYYHQTTPVNSIEEAVFYLGTRQIRQLAMITPVIDDFQKLTGRTQFVWRSFWQHCIATALLTREVITVSGVQPEDADYVAGLIHDVGKIIMASCFGDRFVEIHQRAATEPKGLRQIEVEVLGMDHAELGALYLQHHSLPEVMVETARFHHSPELARRHPKVVAAVQIANLILHQSKIGASGNNLPVSESDWMSASGWNILLPGAQPEVLAAAFARLKPEIERLPTLLEGLV